MQHLPLFPRLVTRNAFPKEALKLLPLYKLKPATVRPMPLTDERHVSSAALFAMRI